VARGRFVSRSVSDSRDFNLKLSSDFNRMLWLMLIPHLDVEGRFWADPVIVKAKILPRRSEVTTEQVAQALDEFESVGFIVRYHDRQGELLLYAPNFARHQRGLRRDREPASSFDAPPGQPREETSSEGESVSSATPAPESCRSDSGGTPAQVQGQTEAQGQAQEQSQAQGQAQSPLPAACCSREVALALHACGVTGDALDDLLHDGWITVPRVDACWAAIEGRQNVKNPTGLLVHMLRRHDEPRPAQPRPDDRAERYKYIRGRHAHLIQR